MDISSCHCSSGISEWPTETHLQAIDDISGDRKRITAVNATRFIQAQAYRIALEAGGVFEIKPVRPSPKIESALDKLGTSLFGEKWQQESDVHNINDHKISRIKPGEFLAERFKCKIDVDQFWRALEIVAQIGGTRNLFQ